MAQLASSLLRDDWGWRWTFTELVGAPLGRYQLLGDVQGCGSRARLGLGSTGLFVFL